MSSDTNSAEPASEAGDADTADDNPEPGSGLQLNFQRRLGRFAKGLGDAFGHLFGDPRADLLAELTQQAPDDGLLDPGAKDLVSNILKVGDQTVEDVVIARADMIAVPTDFNLESILDLAVRHGHSRFPVYKETLDQIVGVVTVKDALKARQGNGPTTAKELARDAIFVAPSMPIMEMLVQMRSGREHMAFVVDEFGGIDGLITLEDLIEQIVGDIEDEHDAEAPSIELMAGGRALADAGVSLEDAEDVLGAFLTDEERDEEIDTLGGLIFTLSGRIPLRGEQIAHDSGLKFLIVEATPRRIRRVELSGIKDKAP